MSDGTDNAKQLVSRRVAELLTRVEQHPPEKLHVALMVGVSELIVEADGLGLGKHLASELKAAGTARSADAHAAESQSALALAIQQRDKALQQAQQLAADLELARASAKPAG